MSATGTKRDSRHLRLVRPLSGTKRTSPSVAPMSANDPKPTPRVTVIAAWFEGLWPITPK